MSVVEIQSAAIVRNEHNQYLRRQALQIAAQLPENVADARAILKHAATLVEGFLLTGEVGD